MKRESFIFYRSFMEALEELNDKQYSKVFRAITKFAIDGEEPQLTGVEKVIFSLIKPQLIANQKRYDNGCKGGRRPNNNQNETETEPNDNQTETKSEPNDNDNVNDNVNVNVNNNLKESKQVSINNNRTYAHEDYEVVMDNFGVSKILRPALWEFIKHCQLNGKKVTNDKLEGIILELDFSSDDEHEKVKVVQNAINGGYFDIKRRPDYA